MSLRFRIWLSEIRAPFLVLSVALVLLGTAMARNEGCFDWLKFVLTLLGLLTAHISVNVFNEYFDYKSGIDFDTTRTPFSGGSGVLPRKLLKPSTVYGVAVGCLLVALLIGIYLTVISGWQLLPLIILGGLAICFYTSHLTRWLIGELVAGLGLGTLPVLGTYFIQTGSYSVEAFVASLAPGFLTANLLLLNEFPDIEADRRGGRYNLVIALGPARAARLYTGLMAMTYFCIIAGVVSKLMPSLSLIALASIPFAYSAARTAIKRYGDLTAFVPALRDNVITILATDLLLALGYFLSRFR